jgi:hypothetical protein
MSHANLSRRTLVASAAALPVLAVPVVANASGSDPILAAIEAHRHAHAATTAAHQSAADDGVDLEDNEHHRLMDKQDRAAFDLLEIQPTTVAGAAALLAYYVEVEGMHAQVFPEHLDGNGRPYRGEEIGVWYGKFGFFLARHAGLALERIIRSEA